MPKGLVILAILIVILIGMLSVQKSFGRTAGVEVGDWVEYVYTYSGNGTLPPPNARIEWMMVTVKQVVGTNVTVERTLRYMDMREETDTFSMDVETGQGNMSLFLIAANLSEGDLIYTSPSQSALEGATINQTLLKEYLGEIVEVNLFQLTTNETGYITISSDFYWCRASGMIVEASDYKLTTSHTWTKIEIRIVDIIPEYPLPLILPLFMTSTLLAVIVYRRKHSP